MLGIEDRDLRGNIRVADPTCTRVKEEEKEVHDFDTNYF